MITVNNRFINKASGKEYVIKGAWDGRYPEASTAFLTCSDFIGHAYAGRATPVKNVWNITDEEFKDMCGGHPEWFTPVNTEPKQEESMNDDIFKELDEHTLKAFPPLRIDAQKAHDRLLVAAAVRAVREETQVTGSGFSFQFRELL